MNKSQKGGADIFGFLLGDSSKKSKSTKISKKKKLHSKLFNKKRSKKLKLSDVEDSESKLIKSLKKLRETKKEYTKTYNEHLQNLITLQDMNGLRNGIVSLFNNTVFNDIKNTENIDYNNPLLVKNYLSSDLTTPKYFKKDFILSQIYYIAYKFFDPVDVLLLDEVPSIKRSDEKGKIVIEYKTLVKGKSGTGEPYYRTISIDKNYILNQSDVKKFLEDTITSVKKQIGSTEDEFEIMSDLSEGDTFHFITKKRSKKIAPVKAKSVPNSFKGLPFKSYKASIQGDIFGELKKELEKLTDDKNKQQEKQQNKQQDKQQNNKPVAPLVKPKDFGNNTTNNKSKKSKQSRKSKPQEKKPNEAKKKCKDVTNENECKNRDECFWNNNNKKCGFNKKKK